MAGATHSAAHAFLEVAPQLYDVLAFSNGERVFLLVCLMPEYADLVGQVTYALCQRVEFQP